MAASNQYRDYIKRSFLRYSFSIISLLFVLVGLFLFINVEWISAGGNKKNNALLAEILDRLPTGVFITSSRSASLSVSKKMVL